MRQGHRARATRHPTGTMGQGLPAAGRECSRLQVGGAKGKLRHAQRPRRPQSDKIDAAFNCLGTTRKDAGSPEAFRKVDLEYTTRFAELAKAANASYFGHLSASNAKKTSWFLYPQTKGEADEAVRSLGFPRTSIFRPGLLNRNDLSRTIESVGKLIFPSITVRAVAKGMLADFETGTSDKEWSNAELKQFEK